MIRLTQLHLPVLSEGQDQEEERRALRKKTASLLGIPEERIKTLRILRRSIDARKKPRLFYSYSLAVSCGKEEKLLRRHAGDNRISAYHPQRYLLPDPIVGRRVSGRAEEKTVIIGSGPAGIFAAYLLALAGLQPLVIERGKTVDERMADVEAFWRTGRLDPSSNVQFGEGGAGTFSDGKLNTQVRDPLGRNRFVLETLAACGAPQEILIDAKPHIGTDILVLVMRNLRQKIIDLGGSFRFQTRMTRPLIQEGRIEGFYFRGESSSDREEEFLPCSRLVLAIGHSARDSFVTLYKEQVPMEAKPFALGFRVEHPQKMIDDSQYGKTSRPPVPASYKLARSLPGRRGVYSFCMCPGGYVVNASSETGRLAVNGMSYANRGSANANSAIVLTVGKREFDMRDPLAGMAYQREMEERAYVLGQGLIPQQLWGDYLANRPSSSYGSFASCARGGCRLTNLRGFLSEDMEADLIDAMSFFGKRISGFDDENAILSAVESRTSSPVRILRGENFQSKIKGLYPCGEGAGYAGGITSAAMDGLKVAEAIIREYADTVT